MKKLLLLAIAVSLALSAPVFCQGASNGTVYAGTFVNKGLYAAANVAAIVLPAYMAKLGAQAYREKTRFQTEKSVQKNALLAGVILSGLEGVGYIFGFYVPSDSLCTQFVVTLAQTIALSIVMTGLLKSRADKKGSVTSMKIAASIYAAGFSSILALSFQAGMGIVMMGWNVCVAVGQWFLIPAEGDHNAEEVYPSFPVSMIVDGGPVGC